MFRKFTRKNEEKKDFVYFGEERVEIERLNIEKWELLLENVESLPGLISNVLASRGSDHFGAKLLLGASIALGEIVTLVSVLTGLDEEFIRKNADHESLSEFIIQTIKRNNLNEALKKFQAVLTQINKVETAEEQN